MTDIQRLQQLAGMKQSLTEGVVGDAIAKRNAAVAKREAAAAEKAGKPAPGRWPIKKTPRWVGYRVKQVLDKLDSKLMRQVYGTWVPHFIELRDNDDIAIDFAGNYSGFYLVVQPDGQFRGEFTGRGPGSKKNTGATADANKVISWVLGKEAKSVDDEYMSR